MKCRLCYMREAEGESPLCHICKKIIGPLLRLNSKPQVAYRRGARQEER
jgi:hypothetical protein